MQITPMTRWVDRTFPSGLDAGLLPAILERLAGAPARLGEKLRAWPAALLVRRDGGWSIQEHAGHLADLDELHLGRLDDFEAAAEILRAADMTNRKTEAAGHDQREAAAILAGFRAGRTRFVDRLAGLDRERLGRRSLHPRLKQPMTPVDMAFFVAEHDDHHLASMSRIARRLGA